MLTDIQHNTKIFTGNVIRANAYNEQLIPSYQGNPYIEALPKNIHNEDALRYIERPIFYNEEVRQWPAIERLHLVQNILTCIVPLPDHFIVLQKIQRMIKNGYQSRNPIGKDNAEFINKIFPGIEWDGPYNGYVPTIRNSAAGFNIFGVSGVGKSTTVESILSMFPQVIEHSKYKENPFDQKQLVWLKLDCPFDGSLKGLCHNFFQLIDIIMGTNKAKKISTRSTTDVLLPMMAQRADALGLGVLLIDEIQRLSLAASGGDEKALNYFIQLANYIGIPVCLIGTYKAFKLFTKQFAMARRGTGQGDMIISNMKMNEDWDYFLDSIWKYQYTAVKNTLEPTLRRAFYEESQGITDIAIKLYMLAQWQVIGSGNERITPDLISDVARESLNAVRPMLDLVRRGDINALQDIDDLFLPQIELDRYLRKAEHGVSLSGSLDTLGNANPITKANNNDDMDLPQDAIAKLLVKAGYEPETAIRCARMACDRFAGEGDIKLASAEAFRVAAEEAINKKEKSQEVKPPTTKKNSKVISLSGDLREIINKRPKGMTPYAALKAAGVIKPVDEFVGAAMG